MNFYQFQLNRYRNLIIQFKLVAIFILLTLPAIAFLVWIRPDSNITFHLGLYFIGWLTWTFGEYMVHRFWQHGSHGQNRHFIITMHYHHHSHPHELKISNKTRMILCLSFLSMLSISILLNNFFSIITGLVFGFMFYACMHVILHKRWSASIFPRLHRYHIFHHCKYPNHCHGISVAWWDLLFRTTPPEDKIIAEKVKSFYYAENTLNNVKSAS
ncbi:MAG TPA: sterol desaturase family protein [Chitinophagaceae bacterium]|nr:sterol desaturase family protein [Chitinophagaceae bacterium]